MYPAYCPLGASWIAQRSEGFRTDRGDAGAVKKLNFERHI